MKRKRKEEKEDVIQERGKGEKIKSSEGGCEGGNREGKEDEWVGEKTAVKREKGEVGIKGIMMRWKKVGMNEGVREEGKVGRDSKKRGIGEERKGEEKKRG